MGAGPNRDAAPFTFSASARVSPSRACTTRPDLWPSRAEATSARVSADADDWSRRERRPPARRGPASCLLQQPNGPGSQPTAEKKKKKSSCRARLLSAGSCQRVGPRPEPGRTRATVNCRRLHVEVFGSGLPGRRALLAHGHASTYSRALTAHARRAVA